MATYLLDTTVLIQVWRAVPETMAWLDHARQDRHVIGTSVVNVGEIYSGAHPGDRAVWDGYFAASLVWDVTRLIAARAGEIRYGLARRGVQVHLPDALVGATAMERRATVVTANVKDFLAMGVKIVQLEGQAPPRLA